MWSCIYRKQNQKSGDKDTILHFVTDFLSVKSRWAAYSYHSLTFPFQILGDLFQILRYEAPF